MDLRNVVGFNIYHAHHRRNFRTLYYSRTMEGEAHSILFFIEKGAAFFDFGKGAVRATAGHMLCYESSTLKNVLSDPQSPPSYQVITFDLLNRLGGLIRPSDIGIPLLSKPGHARAIKARIRSIVRAWNARKGHYLLSCSILGLLLLEDMARSAFTIKTSFVHRGVEREDDKIAPLLDYIRTNYKEDLRVQTLARRAGLKPLALFRTFKKVTGLTPRQYILERKIEQAKDHILIDNLPFSSTAEELGFCDYSNFHRTFKKITHMTPLKYYRMHRGATKL